MFFQGLTGGTRLTYVRLMRDEALQNVIHLYGLSGLARMLGIRKQSVKQWRRVPEDRIIQIEELTGIPRKRLRPDLYGAPRSKKSAASLAA